MELLSSKSLFSEFEANTVSYLINDTGVGWGRGLSYLFLKILACRVWIRSLPAKSPLLQLVVLLRGYWVLSMLKGWLGLLGGSGPLSEGRVSPGPLPSSRLPGCGEVNSFALPMLCLYTVPQWWCHVNTTVASEAGSQKKSFLSCLSQILCYGGNSKKTKTKP